MVRTHHGSPFYVLEIKTIKAAHWGDLWFMDLVLQRLCDIALLETIRMESCRRHHLGSGQMDQFRLEGRLERWRQVCDFRRVS